jgi:hypothetical protein
MYERSWKGEPIHLSISPYFIQSSLFDDVDRVKLKFDKNLEGVGHTKYPHNQPANMSKTTDLSMDNRTARVSKLIWDKLNLFMKLSAFRPARCVVGKSSFLLKSCDIMKQVAKSYTRPCNWHGSAIHLPGKTAFRAAMLSLVEQ